MYLRGILFVDDSKLISVSILNPLKVLLLSEHFKFCLIPLLFSVKAKGSRQKLGPSLSIQMTLLNFLHLQNYYHNKSDLNI